MLILMKIKKLKNEMCVCSSWFVSARKKMRVELHTELETEHEMMDVLVIIQKVLYLIHIDAYFNITCVSTLDSVVSA